jgi:hypothetical protein
MDFLIPKKRTDKPGKLAAADSTASALAPPPQLPQTPLQSRAPFRLKPFARSRQAAAASAVQIWNFSGDVRLESGSPLILIHPSDLAALIRSQLEVELPKLMQEASLTPDPLMAARLRGDSYKRSELAKAENLTLAEAAQRRGISEKWLNTLRQRGEAYALVEDGRERGFRYPSWQFAAKSDRLIPVLSALTKAGVGCWGIHSFMLSPSRDLTGKTPREFILDDDAPLIELLNVVERRFAAEQGAQ